MWIIFLPYLWHIININICQISILRLIQYYRNIENKSAEKSGQKQEEGTVTKKVDQNTNLFFEKKNVYVRN